MEFLTKQKKQYNLFTRPIWPSAKNLFITLFLLIVAGLTIYSPIIVVSTNLPSFKIEDPLILLAIVYLLLCHRHTRGHGILAGKDIRPLTIPFFVFSAWMIFITLIHIIFEPKLATIFGSIFYIISTFKGVILAVMIVALVRNKKMLKTLTNGIIIYLALQVFILYAQMTNLYNIHGWLTPLYRRGLPERFAQLLARTPGTFGNPNVAGIAVAAMCAIPISRAILSKNIFSVFLNFGLAAIATIAVIQFTGSRTATFCCLFAFIIPLLITLLFKSHHRHYALFWCGILTLTIVLALPLLSRTIRANRFTVITEKGMLLKEANFYARTFNWQIKLNDMGTAIFLGKGASNAIGKITDSGYISVILVGGIVGLILYLWVFLRIIWLFVKKLLQGGLTQENTYLIIGSLSCICVFIVGNITASLFSNSRCWATCAMILSLGLCALKLHRKK